MSFFAASEPAIHYDTNGVSIEAVSVAACKDEDKPKLFGAAPVEASCTVVRSGSRDIAPPPVARTSSDLDALQRALAATYPGAVAPCPARDGGAAAAQIFLDRCLAHAEFGDSPLLVDFLLQRDVPASVTQAALPGGDVSITASANKALYGSTKAEDVDDARSWSAEKDRLLSDVEQRAHRAAAALSAAAKESAGLLAAGGVLVDRGNAAADSALAAATAGVEKAAAAFADLRRQISALDGAAVVVRTLRERRAAATEISKSTKVAFDKSEREPDDFFSSMTGTKTTRADVERDFDRRAALEKACDEAAERFAKEARAFIEAFPATWTKIIDALVDDQAAAARAAAGILEAARDDGSRLPPGDLTVDGLSSDAATTPTSPANINWSSAERRGISPPGPISPQTPTLPDWAAGLGAGEQAKV